MAVIATSTVVQAGQVRNEVPDKERHPGPPWLGVEYWVNILVPLKRKVS
jgi:hypothetical protein